LLILNLDHNLYYLIIIYIFNVITTYITFLDHVSKWSAIFNALFTIFAILFFAKNQKTILIRIHIGLNLRRAKVTVQITALLQRFLIIYPLLILILIYKTTNLKLQKTYKKVNKF